MTSELALPFFSHRVCNMHGTEVDVVCAPRVTLNRDIIGHYCPLLSMVNDQICPAVILTRSQPITITTLNGLDIDCVCLKDKKQQQMANFPELHNLLLLLYAFAFSHFIYPLLTPSS